MRLRPPFLEARNNRACAEPVQAAVKMMPHIHQRFARSICNLAQACSLKKEPLQCESLSAGQTCEGAAHCRCDQAFGDGAFQIIAPHQDILHLIDTCAIVKTAPGEKAAAVDGLM